MRQRGERVFGEIAAGQLKVSIGHEYRLASADQAHAALESGSTRGKAILIP
ncbi:MAG: zinc-binding dehydrogenase [Bifidobacteriaceae bacterium]|nr:zinc-binding dehydrogenase [Bifidobacteriaceae bacterium]